MPDDEVLLIESGGETNTTINRMELMAINRAITHFMMSDIEPTTIRIISDSAYSIGSLTEWNDKQSKNGWKNTYGESIKNMKLIRSMLVTLHTIKKQHTIHFIKVKGHSGHHYNHEADRHAGIERAKRL
jgi:ribonuclease HI